MTIINLTQHAATPTNRLHECAAAIGKIQ